jgi:hypothetical protein
MLLSHRSPSDPQFNATWRGQLAQAIHPRLEFDLTANLRKNFPRSAFNSGGCDDGGRCL